MEETMRPLHPHEKEVLNQLAAMLPTSEKAMLEADLNGCFVSDAVPDGSRLIFILKDYERPPYVGQHAYPVEGYLRDADGAEMTVCLYADQNDRLLEFEIIKWDDAPLINPNWSSFTTEKQ